MMRRFLILLTLLLPLPALAAEAPVSLSARVDSQTPYRNQPILYTLRLVSHASLSNLGIGDVHVEGAIVTEAGKPDVADALVGGVPSKVVEFHFVITPLQSGRLAIAPFEIQGEYEVPDRPLPVDPFGGNMMAGILRAMKALGDFGAGWRAFHLQSNDIVLDVKPPAAAMDPWLPLKTLSITEDTSAAGAVHAGEPLIRKITISASGAVGSQLPDTERQQQQDGVKIYADPPKISETVDGKTGAIQGSRIESYSLVPQKSGRLVLPAIHIAWWDIVHGRAAMAELPARSVMVLPGAALPAPPVADIDATGAGQTASGAITQTAPKLSLSTVWARFGTSILWGAALFVLVPATFTAWRLNKRRPVRLRKARPRGAPAASWKNIRDPAALQNFLQAYAHVHLDTPRHAALERIFAAAPLTPAERDAAGRIARVLTGALYAGAAVDIADIKRETQRLLPALAKKSRKTRSEFTALDALNSS